MSYQRWIQLAIIVLAVGSLFVIMALLLRWVIRPTEALRRGIESVTRGNLSTRVNPEPTSEEFERIGQGFNAMAGRLEDLVENLEGKVTEKTQAVEEKTAILRSFMSCLLTSGVSTAWMRSVKALRRG